ncbi:MAG: glycosyltransferase [Candidatus Omnitrophica bacterium]|nr:glycosyltransferase [Candidatus Omnitrophota bacterium]
MLRILSLNYEFPPIGGGGGNAHKHLLREFSLLDDLHVTFVSITDKTEPIHESYSSNVNLYLLPLKKKSLLYWRRGEVVRYLAMHYGFLREFLKTHSFDLCHVFFGFPTGLLAYLYRAQMPYLVSVRGSDVPGFNKRFSLDYILLRPLLKRIYSSARAVVANSQGLRELFESQFPRLKAGVIPNGIDTEMYQPVERADNPEPHLAAVARLIPRKGIDLLIEACAEIERDGLPFQCHIIGDGPEEESLKRRAQRLGIAERVHFHGRMEKQDLANFLPQCDIFVLPSYAEGMSNAALEAMACGLPLLLTDTGGSRELMDGNGFIVPPGDAHSLADRLRAWIGEPGVMRTMGKRSRMCANAFSWANVARRHRDLYYQLTERRRES